MNEEESWLSVLRRGVSTLVEQIRDRAISPIEVTTAVIERIDQLDEHIGSFITVSAERSLAEAAEREQDLTRDVWRGPLHGIPFSVKDVLYSEGIRTTAGSQILREFIPSYDAAVVERIRAAGGILIGKTNLHEFQAGATNWNPHFGPCRNPWDLDLISGGSSGGSAAAVAAQLSPFSIGVDTGGSIRIPAAFCGVVGFKPSFGLISRFGMVPESWSCDHVGPLTANVTDAALVADVMAGFDSRDPSSVDGMSDGFKFDVDETTSDGLAGIRIGLANSGANGANQEIRRAVDVAAQQLEVLGAHVEMVDLPDASLVSDVLQTIIWSEAAAYHRKWLRDRRDDYGQETRWKFESGLLQGAVDYIEAQRIRRVLNQRIGEILSKVDVVLSPTVPIPAPQVEEAAAASKEFEKALALEGRIARLTPLASLVGLPAISVPCGFTGGRVPIGLMMVGGRFEDKKVLRVAREYEKVSGWRQRKPLIAT